MNDLNFLICDLFYVVRGSFLRPYDRNTVVVVVYEGCFATSLSLSLPLDVLSRPILILMGGVSSCQRASENFVYGLLKKPLVSFSDAKVSV